VGELNGHSERCFEEDVRFEDLPVALALQEHLIPARERGQFRGVAENRSHEQLVEASCHLFRKVATTSRGRGLKLRRLREGALQVECDALPSLQREAHETIRHGVPRVLGPAVWKPAGQRSQSDAPAAGRSGYARSRCSERLDERRASSCRKARRTLLKIVAPLTMRLAQDVCESALELVVKEARAEPSEPLVHQGCLAAGIEFKALRCGREALDSCLRCQRADVAQHLSVLALVGELARADLKRRDGRRWRVSVRSDLNIEPADGLPRRSRPVRRESSSGWKSSEGLSQTSSQPSTLTE
jgi:hypothetical protein